MTDKEKIAELEALNARLSEQVDRQGKVVEAARPVVRDWIGEKKMMGSDDGELAATDHIHLDALQSAITTYERELAGLMKEGECDGQG